jgi:hypothetical protein
VRGNRRGRLRHRSCDRRHWYDRIPWLPDWPGSIGFPKPFLHVAALRRAADLAGLGVLLVGAGNSGVEIAGLGIDGLWCADLLNRG